MMGSSHALSGAAVWLTGSLAMEYTGAINGQSALELAVGTAVCAGGALLPDLDLSGRPRHHSCSPGRRMLCDAFCRGSVC